MKGRGKNYERSKGKRRAKIDKTVKKMNKTRQKDDIRLRKNIKEKLEWAISEKKKAEETIANWNKNIQINSREILKLTGIILVLSQLLEESNIKKEK